jgi:hypothetical protein
MTEGFQLTADESALVMNSEWIHTKHRIIAKVYQLFGTLSEKYQSLLAAKNLLPQEVINISPKISKGERYLDLPYVMLDYPRLFGREDTLAIRSLFWWGNHFSIHLVLGGKYRQLFEGKLTEVLRSGRLNGWYLGVGDDPWQHHFEDDNYKEITGSQVPADGSHIKLAKWLSLREWENAGDFFLESYNTVLNLLFDYQ